MKKEIKQEKPVKKREKLDLSKIIEELFRLEAEKELKVKKKDDDSLEKKVETKLKKTKLGVKKGAEKKDKKPENTGLYSGKTNFDQSLESLYGLSKLDYETLFNYLGSGKDGYQNHIKELEYQSITSSTTDILSEEKVDYIMKRKMISIMLGGIPDYFDPDTEEKYGNWRVFNHTDWWWKLTSINNTVGKKDFVSNNDFYKA